MRSEARPRLALVALAVASGVLGYGFVAVRLRSSPRTTAVPSASVSATTAARPSSANATTAQSSAAGTRPRPPALDEAALMTQARSLRGVAPEQALALARQGNASFPSGVDAAERAWIIVRSLEDLRRFHEAVAEARAMRERYPGTPWTDDVERHTLVYPLDQPSREAQQAAASRDP